MRGLIFIFSASSFRENLAHNFAFHTGCFAEHKGVRTFVSFVYFFFFFFVFLWPFFVFCVFWEVCCMNKLILQPMQRKVLEWMGISKYLIFCTWCCCLFSFGYPSTLFLGWENTFSAWPECHYLFILSKIRE